jgi:ADP-ribosylglycohydrolase
MGSPVKHGQEFSGCLLGTAVGDALGLPCEGLTPRRQKKLFPNIRSYHLLLGRGMVSDDTDHACLTAQALLSSGDDAKAFEKFLARELKMWLATLPAGVGFATLRAVVRLWLGVHRSRSGVFSAGNGPAMRAPIIGIYCTIHRPALLRLFVNASTHITHTDPKAEYGAFAVALAAALALEGEDVEPDDYLKRLQVQLGPDAREFTELMAMATVSAKFGQTSEAFCSDMGLESGISGYTYHTVPAVIQTWLRHQSDLAGAVEEIIRCGGDTDTTAAIVGGIIGARVGTDGIPPEWINGLFSWPHTASWIEELGRRLFLFAHGLPSGRMPRYPAGLVLRNLLLFAVVLVHGFRRLFPPY